MIRSEDLNPKGFDLTEEQLKNLERLAPKISAVEDRYKLNLFKITSGVRSIADHYRIYKEKGIDHPPTGSQHLKGNAVDIADPEKKLQAWCISEEGLQCLEEYGLYCEDFDYTSKPNPWVHFQQVPPKSGKRFFVP